MTNPLPRMTRTAPIVALLCAAALQGCSIPVAYQTETGVNVPVAAHGDPASAPTQPIPYSHKLHAGQYQIPCQYCHAYAGASPVANIPAMSTCMNCHRFVGQDKPGVQKLLEYYNKGQEIPWVSVHRLPDHVFFNHKRHVKAGLQCQNCHGPIQTMDKVYQYSNLKMGWCVDCHKSNMNHPKFGTSIDCLTCHK